MLPRRLAALRVPPRLWVVLAAVLTLIAAAWLTSVQAQRSEWDRIIGLHFPATIRFSPDFHQIATSSIYGVQLWDASSKRRLDDLGDSSLATQFMFFPDDYLAWSNTSYVLFYDLRLNKLSGAPIKADSRVSSMAASPVTYTFKDGVFATGSETAVELWEYHAHIGGDLSGYLIPDSARTGAVSA